MLYGEQWTCTNCRWKTSSSADGAATEGRKESPKTVAKHAAIRSQKASSIAASACAKTTAHREQT